MIIVTNLETETCLLIAEAEARSYLVIVETRMRTGIYRILGRTSRQSYLLSSEMKAEKHLALMRTKNECYLLSHPTLDENQYLINSNIWREAM